MRKHRLFAPLLFLLIFSFIGCADRAQEKRQYTLKAHKTGELMVNQASACISQSRAYQAVWEYARVSDVDFKTAAAQMLGPQTSQNKTTMVENKAMIESLLDELKDPPAAFEETYKRLKEIYEIYTQLHDLAMTPLDDMNDHMESVNDLSGQILEKSRELVAALVIK